MTRPVCILVGFLFLPLGFLFLLAWTLSGRWSVGCGRGGRCGWSVGRGCSGRGRSVGRGLWFLLSILLGGLFGGPVLGRGLGRLVGGCSGGIGGGR